MSYIGVQKQGWLWTVIDKSECLVGVGSCFVCYQY